MKTRIISIGFGLLILLPVVWFIDTAVLRVMIVLVGALAVVEMVKMTGLSKNIKVLIVYELLMITALCFDMNRVYNICGFLFFTFVLMVSDSQQKMNPASLFTAATMLIVVFLGLSSIISIESLEVVSWDKRFVLLLCLFSAWLCDIFSYIFGRWLGKTKLTPISPKKTVAGAVGGVISASVLIAVITALFSLCEGSIFIKPTATSIIFFFFMGLIASIISIIGDISFSVVKRIYKKKDYGNIMPGHGGVCDRFDSVFFTSTFIMWALNIYTRIFA